MANCPNCRRKIGCSCKLRKATRGKQCCVSCVTQENNVTKQQQKKIKNSAPGVILSATAVQAPDK